MELGKKMKYVEFLAHNLLEAYCCSVIVSMKTIFLNAKNVNGKGTKGNGVSTVVSE